MKRTSDSAAAWGGWRAIVGIVLLVLLIGILAVQFVPVERLRGWPLYVAGAFLLTGVAVELFLFGVEIIAVLADGLERVSHLGRRRRRGNR